MGHDFQSRPGWTLGTDHETMSNKERMEDNWSRMRSQIQSTWENLDDSDLKKARGDLKQMVNLIHNETGEDRALIMRKMSAFI
ncbi:MAG: general stress protein CsbD [Bacteroidota bacterium]